MKKHLFLTLCAILLLSACQQQIQLSQMQQQLQQTQPPQEEEAAQEEPIVYRDPQKAFNERKTGTVSIEMNPKWNLTEAQMATAQREPQQVEGADPVRYLYPEDIEPTEEEKANGTALTDKQRTAMKQARKAAMEKACKEAYQEAERYNKEHAADFAEAEKKGKHIVVYLNKQKGEFKDGDRVLLSFPVCSGRKGKSTPRGHFHVLEKDRHHHSNLYNNASMPYFMRLTWCGVGLHQGHLAGHPASHGCIRLNTKTARFLFMNCGMGTPVFVY